MSTTPMEPLSEPINVAETLAEIRRRVAARLARTVPEIPELAVPPLEPLRQARAVAEGWAGSMGVVNPRPPGPLSSLLQGIKKLMARSLRWFAFPQIQFNSGVTAALIRAEEMFADVNRNLVVLGQNLADRGRQEAELGRRIKGIEEGTRLVLSVMREELDRQEDRLTVVAHSTEEISRSVGRAVEEVSRSVSKSLEEIQGDVGRVEQNFWQDFARYREEQAVLQAALDEEVRLVRQRLRTLTGPQPGEGGRGGPPLQAGATVLPSFDYPRFEERFRGKEEEIRKRQEFYLRLLEGQGPVLDVACGRGEMLEILRDRGMEARGVDLDPDMVERCRSKKLAAERADALAFLESQPDAALGAIFSAQFIEHLPVAVYSRLIELAYAKLRKGGRLILETQNPECLAIYSQTFFMDPTHVRPVPAAQLHFLLSEAGFTGIETHYLSPVGETLPQLPLWAKNGGPPDAAAERWNKAAERFNQTYFGHMDYAVAGRKG